ncbi:MAG: menaquinone biosynthesis decarboxylase [Acidobacteria bacterium]|nr:menaquinone biosynthesis decarboxylase [Acidobacteriota bacterium]|tara:strand:- start:6026 stop:7951 length:1926 start_codon:yes stop_codon:yes gene_type:complete
MPYSDLQGFASALESANELRRIDALVDPYLEIAEIYDRVVKREGPALLFENVRGSDYPLLINPLGSARRIELAFGRHPGEIGASLLEMAQAAQPPQPRKLWKQRSTIREVLWNMRVSHVRRAPVHQVIEKPDLSRLPVQTCWPEDGGPFITFGLVITKDPETRQRNVGLYRIQVYDATTAGMHWQIQKGGGFHYNKAERLGIPLEVAVVIGADPYLLIAAITSLPEGIDEISFSGLMRRAPCKLVRCKTIDLEVPAEAEIVLEGVVPPRERRLEGPFGDHFGHYSHASEFPVFHVKRVTRRRAPLYLSATVGKPPQEDKHIGNAVQEMIGPLIKLIHPEIKDLWAYYETGFHNLLVMSMDERYYKESMRTALALMGTGQLSLTKCGVLVDGNVNVSDFDAVLREIRDNFDPASDFLLLPGVPQDTLDFTSFKMNLGSKMVLDATSGAKRTLHGTPGSDAAAVADAAGGDIPSIEGDFSGLVVPGFSSADFGDEAIKSGARDEQNSKPASRLRVADPCEIDSRILSHITLQDSLLVVQVKVGGREVVERLVQAPLGSVKMVAAVSPDVPLDNRDLLLWGIFTRFDCARDIVFTEVQRRGAWTTCHGVMGIDATFKPGYPKPLDMDPDIVEKVDRRWAEYGID